MDHRTIDAENVAERYVTGRLPEADAARFEEHYLDCPDCCARVEAAERLGRGMRRLAEEAASGDAAAARSAVAGRSPLWGLAAAAAVILALLPAGFEWRRTRTLERDLAAARGALARPSVDAPGVDRVAALAAELARTRHDLAAAAARLDGLAGEVAAERLPQTAIPILALSPLRGGESAPVRTLALPRRPGWVALWIEPGGDEAAAYRVKLADAHGATVFAAERLPPNDLGALLVTLHSSTLAAGRYRLTVDALPAAAGAPRPVAVFPIRIVAPT